jgi:amino acid transporter
VGKLSIRRFDVQAKISLIVSVVAALGVVGLVMLIIRNYNSEMQVVLYSRKGMFAPAVYLTTAITLLLAATGAAIGANSAGQKRNEFTRRSWLAFFIGIATISATIICFSVYWFLKFPMS